MNLEEYLNLVKKANDAQDSYYGKNISLIDDYEYDLILKSLIDFERENPDLVSIDSPVGKVGSPKTVEKTFKHATPMLSLDNIFSKDDLDHWVKKVEKILTYSIKSFYVEPKLDGLAISAIYLNGTLEKVITRGDGEFGEDVTGQSKGLIKGLPLKIKVQKDIEVRGEVLMTDLDFKESNEIRAKNNEEQLSNPRNGASGALRAKNSKVKLPLTFFAYQYQNYEGTIHDSIVELKNLGFNTTFNSKASPVLTDSKDKLIDYINNLGEIRGQLGFGIDGAVIKLNNTLDREKSGFTSRSPRWAVAYKYPSDLRLSKLLAIELQIGRTGAITPVAKILPVEVGGTIISSVTLHNPEEIKRKNIMINDSVWVRRAGEVIPEIVSVELTKRNGSEIEFIFPDNCPKCSASLNKEQEVWRCPNPSCSKLAKIIYFTSRDALNIEGLGETHLTNLYNLGFITNPEDIYKLDKDTLLKIDRMGDKLASKILLEIKNSKKLPLSKLLTALGFTNIGKRASEKLARNFGNIENLLSASKEELTLVEGIGEKRGETLFLELRDNTNTFEFLKSIGHNLTQPIDIRENTNSFISGKSFCITGSFEKYNRDELKEMIERNGGATTTSVTSKTDFLLAGEKAGSKLKKASDLGVAVISIEELAEYIPDLNL